MGMVRQNQSGGWYLTTTAFQLPLPLHLAEGSSRRNSPPPSSSSSITLLSGDIEEEERNEHPENLRSDSPDNEPVDNLEIRHWLLRGGIGANSVKMRQLLLKNLNINFVKAHVLERLYRVKLHENNPTQHPNYPVGWLINKLQCGDTAPPMRCSTCLNHTRYCTCRQ